MHCHLPPKTDGPSCDSGQRLFRVYRRASGGGAERGGHCRGRGCRGVLPLSRFAGFRILAIIPALTAACAGVETVFHCAGYAHAFSALSGDDAARHREINFEGTRNLVEAAGQAGVKRFVFLSSVKAMAEPGAACADEDFPGEPATAYGQAKRAAEAAVLEAGRRYGMHVVNLRLAMVYGAGGRGNLERMGQAGPARAVSAAAGNGQPSLAGACG